MLSNNAETVLLNWTMPYVIDPILDSPIELWELKNVVNNLKDNKAPGDDGISYEFYKHAPITFLEETFQIVFERPF